MKQPPSNASKLLPAFFFLEVNTGCYLAKVATLQDIRRYVCGLSAWLCLIVRTLPKQVEKQEWQTPDTGENTQHVGIGKVGWHLLA